MPDRTQVQPEDRSFSAELVRILPHLRAFGRSLCGNADLADDLVQETMLKAWKARAPTLIMSDVGDWRVTIPQAYKLYRALSDNKVPVKFVAYPVPGHSPADPIRARDVWRRWVDWLKPYLAPAP